MTDGLQEIRCPNCGRLLLKARPGSIIETKCPNCKSLVRWPILEPEIIHEPKKRVLISET